MTSDLWIEAEKRVQAALQLGLDLLARALDQVHGHVGLVAGRQLEGGILDFRYLAFGKQSKAVD